jgi:hypothetical protein
MKVCRSRTIRALAVIVTCAWLAAGCIPAGTHSVSSFGAGGVSPGVWHSLGPVRPGAPCHWHTGSVVDLVLPQVLSDEGPVWLEIAASDRELTTDGCFPFWQEPGPFARSLHEPGASFGPGDFRVGAEIAPGRYRAAGGTYEQAPPPNDFPFPICTWARVASFRPDRASVIEHGSQPDVTIEPGDVGFLSQHCGTWTRIGEQ